MRQPLPIELPSNVWQSAFRVPLDISGLSLFLTSSRHNSGLTEANFECRDIFFKDFLMKVYMFLMLVVFMNLLCVCPCHRHRGCRHLRLRIGQRSITEIFTLNSCHDLCGWLQDRNVEQDI
jgi:hypothetical protein